RAVASSACSGASLAISSAASRRNSSYVRDTSSSVAWASPCSIFRSRLVTLCIRTPFVLSPLHRGGYTILDNSAAGNGLVLPDMEISSIYQPHGLGPPSIGH